MSRKQRRLLVAGQLAVTPYYMGCGSRHMNGYRIDSPLEEIRKLCEEPVSYVPAYELRAGYPPEDVPNEDMVEEAVKAAGEHAGVKRTEYTNATTTQLVYRRKPE